MKELDFIAQIAQKSLHGPSDSSLLLGIGDDCAVFGFDQDVKWVVSTDLLAENVHFRLDWHDPFLLGRKSIAVNLSDIAAMGAEPCFALLSLSLPDSLSPQWIERWQDGVLAILNEFHCKLIGGDTTRGERLVINVTVLGKGRKDALLYRSAAKEGDDIYVTGTLGDAAAGLFLLEQGLAQDIAVQQRFPSLLQAHLDPVPQVEVGTILAQSHSVAAMQDLSDGIATDIAHICKASKVAAVLHKDWLPCSSELDDFSVQYTRDKFTLMLCGGEDYQLVFTAERKFRIFLQRLFEEKQFRCSRIGHIEAGAGVFLLDGSGKRTEIGFSGFEHGA